jgi:hypothetical protein
VWNYFLLKIILKNPLVFVYSNRFVLEQEETIKTLVGLGEITVCRDYEKECATERSCF